MSIVHEYTRRVSFNNIDPECNEFDDYDHLGGGSNTDKVDSTFKFNDINFGYGSLVINDVSRYYDHNNINTVNQRVAASKASNKLKRKRVSPSKLILKNKLSPQQLQYNIKNSKTLGINYHENLDDLIKHANISPINSGGSNNGDSSDDDDDNDDDSHYTYGRKLSNATDPKPSQPKTRRKSYSEMSYDELMALDPQFSNTKSKIDQFKFDNQKTYYLPSKKQPVAPPKLSVNKLDASDNYKSINLTFKHDEFWLNRTILTVISGRSHTWNSLYWLINSDLLQDNDYLIISSLISPKAMACSKNASDVLLDKCSKLINWFLNELKKTGHNNHLRIKVTVEFIIDESTDELNGNKPFFNNLFRQYNPNLLVLSNKSSNLNFKYPIKLKEAKNKFLVKFSSYLVKYSSIPVIMLNNGIMNPNIPSGSSSHKDSVVSIESSNSSLTSSDEEAEDEEEDEDEDEDEDETPVVGKELYLRAQESMALPVVFENMVKRISDRSLKESKDYLEQLKHYEAQDEDGSPKPYHPHANSSSSLQPLSPRSTVAGQEGEEKRPSPPAPPQSQSPSQTSTTAGPSIKFDATVNFSANSSMKPSTKKSRTKSKKPLNSKIHSIYTSQLSRQSSLGNSEMYKVKSLIDSNSTDNVSSRSLKSVKSNDSGVSSYTRRSSASVNGNGSGMTTKMIKASLKNNKEAEKNKPKPKKSVWKRMFS